MRLQVEVVFVDGRRAAVDDGARLGVPVLRGMLGVHGEEARVVPLAADNDCQLGIVRAARGDPPERLPHLGHLLSDDDGKLALGDSQRS